MASVLLLETEGPRNHSRRWWRFECKNDAFSSGEIRFHDTESAGTERAEHRFPSFRLSYPSTPLAGSRLVSSVSLSTLPWLNPLALFEYYCKYCCWVCRKKSRGSSLCNAGFYKWGMGFLLGIGAGRVKIFVSTLNLWNIVSFLHLLVATDHCYTPNKLGARKPKCWGPMWITKKIVRSVRRITPKLIFHLWDPNDSVLEIQICMAYSVHQ